MLVLDEQLLGCNLEGELARWHRGPVLFIANYGEQVLEYA